MAVIIAQYNRKITGFLFDSCPIQFMSRPNTIFYTFPELCQDCLWGRSSFCQNTFWKSIKFLYFLLIHTLWLTSWSTSCGTKTQKVWAFQESKTYQSLWTTLSYIFAKTNKGIICSSRNNILVNVYSHRQA